MMNTVKIGTISIGNENPLCLIAGPCVIEGEEVVLRLAKKIKTVADRVNIPFIFKSSYLKDNRSSATTYQGPGLEHGLKILAKVKKEFDIPVLSDVHGIEDVDRAAEVLDILQIPAYLSMQTSLTLKVGKTGKPVNIKKGQFLHPLDMKNVIGKLEYTGNRNILLTERGSCFGYRQLVADIKSLPLMRSLGYPVVFDSTHIIRNYGISSSESAGGNPLFIPHLSRAGVAAGCDAIFIETHDFQTEALCDAASMLPFEKLEGLLVQLIRIDRIVRGNEK